MKRISWSSYIGLPFCVLLVTVSLFSWQCDIGFSLRDESYLWYGVQRVLAGEVPIRDFMSYDPGRYYWSALFLYLRGDDGVIATRIGIAAFQGIGLVVALWLLQPLEKEGWQRLIFIILASLVLLVWMFPRHKIFDVCISIFSIAALKFLLDKPSLSRYYITGIYIGLIAIFGRNHAVYGLFSFLAALVWIEYGHFFKKAFWVKIGFFALGVVTGYMPMLLMIGFTPGFYEVFWEGVAEIFIQKSTNISIPIPWPWTVDYVGISLEEGLRQFFIGCAFIAILVFAIGGPLHLVYSWFYKRTVHPLLAVSVFLALPYAHFAFSRAGLNHLCQGIFPLLIGCFVWISMRKDMWRWGGLVGFVGLSMFIMLPAHPLVKYVRSPDRFTETRVTGDLLKIETEVFEEISFFQQRLEPVIKRGATFVVAPYYPGIYAILRKKSPLWEIYIHFALRTSTDFQKKEISRIRDKQPEMIILSNAPLDGMNERRYRYTHPLLYRYVKNNYRFSDEYSLKEKEVYVFPKKE